MEKATAHLVSTKARPEKARPESLPHGTTEDQINEMESEGGHPAPPAPRVPVAK